MTMSAQTQAHKADGSLVILPFHIRSGTGEMRCFVNVQKVSKVFNSKPLTPFMDPLGVISGLYDDQGVAIPVIDVRRWLIKNLLLHDDGSSTRPHASISERIIVCSIMGHLIGILVEKTKKIERWNNSELLPPPSLGAVDDGLVMGMLRDEQGFRYMLNVENILNQAGLTQVVAPSVQGQSLKGKRILLVEDSRFFMKLASQTLRLQGAEVFEARHGEEGLEKLAELTHLDLVVVDIEMPFVNGIDMVRRFKAEKPESTLPFLFHTSMTNDTLFQDIERERLGRCISKFSAVELLHNVEILLQVRPSESRG